MTRITKLALLQHLYIEPQIYQILKRGKIKKLNVFTPHWNLMATLQISSPKLQRRSVKTLQQEFPAPKFRPEKVDQCDVVYKIPCTTCSWSYIGETRRSFSTRKKEHARNVKMCAKGSNVANHAWSKNHQIDF